MHLYCAYIQIYEIYKVRENIIYLQKNTKYILRKTFILVGLNALIVGNVGIYMN